MLKVELISSTPNPERAVASAAKLCYSKVGVEEIMQVQSEEDTVGFIKELTSINHLSPFEHASFTFAIEGVSRTLTHQLVRHRIASFSQQSQRYVKETNFEYVTPPSIKDNERAKHIFIEHMKSTQKAYDDLLIELMLDSIINDGKYIEWCAEVGLCNDGECGDELIRNSYNDLIFGVDTESFMRCLDVFRDKMPKTYARLEKKAIEDSRYVFPNAAETKIVVTMNARSLMNFFNLRCCNRAQWEIRDMADKMMREVYKVAPAIFANSGAPCTIGSCPEGNMSCGQTRPIDDIIGDHNILGEEFDIEEQLSLLSRLQL